jgi:hypothetical protein
MPTETVKPVLYSNVLELVTDLLTLKFISWWESDLFVSTCHSTATHVGGQSRYLITVALRVNARPSPSACTVKFWSETGVLALSPFAPGGSRLPFIEHLVQHTQHIGCCRIGEALAACGFDSHKQHYIRILILNTCHPYEFRSGVGDLENGNAVLATRF